VVDTLVGMQWGSEGKGKVAAHLAKEYNAMVRSGGPQAGHTFYDLGETKHVLRQIPCGVIEDKCLLFITAGGLINVDVLASELKFHPLYPDRLMIDPHTMVVTEKHIEEERVRDIEKRIASTVEGVGAAQSDKVWRTARLFAHYAENDPELYFFCDNTSEHINTLAREGYSILLEGTQGFGLSLNHGSYPYCTSRDVTSAALMGDAGVSPRYYRRTIGVMRTYPIRVGGNSGPAGTSEELDWNTIRSRSGHVRDITEHTTVTGRVRRVFEQDFDILRQAVMVNSIDQIALMFIDYICADDYGVMYFDDLSKASREYIDLVESTLDVPVVLIGTGPLLDHIIDRRAPGQRQVAIPISYEDRQKYGFKCNFMNYSWYSGYFENYIDRKLQVERKIFLFS
jgi:adenylosuccinate synthase